MGNSIKRQFLIIAITLSLFVLGSVGVATAGVLGATIATNLKGTFKGKQYCGLATAIFLGDSGEKEKFKYDVKLWIDFSDFPDVDALLDLGPFGLVDLRLDGYAVPKNNKKGVITMEVDDLWGITPLNNILINMNGNYKNNDLGALTKIDGNLVVTTHLNEFDALFPDRALDTVCVSQKGAKFKLKGEGNIVLIPD